MIFDVSTGKLIITSHNNGGGQNNTPETFKSVTAGMNFTITQNVSGDIDYITYTNGADTIIKTFNYTGDVLTSLVLSGDVPAGMDTTFTLVYTSGEVSGGSYS